MTWRPGGFRVGSMRERITVQDFTATVDEHGQTIRDYRTLRYREPAQFLPTSGGENIRGRQIEAGVNAAFIVRYRPDYDATKRVVHNGIVYGIVYVHPVDGGRRYLDLRCKAVNNG